MRALLVNPWVYDFKAFDFWNKPIGLLIVSSILKKYGFTIDFIDCMDRASPYFSTDTKTDSFGRGKYMAETVEKPKMFKRIPRRYKRYGMPRQVFIDLLNKLEQPDIIMVTSSMTYWYPGVLESIKILKGKYPKVTLILGGLYATLCEKHAREFSGADNIITGQAHNNLSKFLAKMDIIKYILNDDSEALPDYSLYSNLNYGVILTSTGCPYNCSYCATKYLTDDFHQYSREAIIAQLDYLSGKTRNIAFFDDALLYNKIFLQILEDIIKRRYDLNLHSSNGLHCRFIDRKVARLMREANFKTIYLSLETTNPDIQQKTGGKVFTDEFIRAVCILKEAGFPNRAIHVYLLYGLPGQSHMEIVDSIKLCHDLGINPHLCEFSPIPHTIEFNASGFNEDTDPLYHNNLYYTWYHPEHKPEIYKKIKKLLSSKPASQII